MRLRRIVNIIGMEGFKYVELTHKDIKDFELEDKNFADVDDLVFVKHTKEHSNSPSEKGKIKQGVS